MFPLKYKEIYERAKEDPLFEHYNNMVFNHSFIQIAIIRHDWLDSEIKGRKRVLVDSRHQIEVVLRRIEVVVVTVVV